MIDGTVNRSEHVLIDLRMFLSEEDQVAAADNLINAALNKLGDQIWAEWAPSPRDLNVVLKVEVSAHDQKPAMFFNREAVQ